ncbi:hypothetical protein [Paenibacillus sp. MMS18-CY102]|uniref:hypothetical protein n=1 Tax=Paenibacillus sp. MMS18-CY102 TaxID=2682849 RepID=UPI0013660CDA|nr:hypothetical protein [Paenibacillus sp. MMS18-CY102]MWC31315.1 hypothetical protein [Paenibacillus sp. MMS18-CY102]
MHIHREHQSQQLACAIRRLRRARRALLCGKRCSAAKEISAAQQLIRAICSQEQK